MDVPPTIAELNGKPGDEWTDAEAERVRLWWAERRQMRLIWAYAARYLGPSASQEDIEDAVVDFYMLFDPALRSYRPGEIDFSLYLLTICFRNHCYTMGRRIRARSAGEVSLDSSDSMAVTYTLELEDPAPGSDPVRRAHHLAFLQDIAALLNGPRLTAKQKRVFVLRYFAQMSHNEIAVEMQAPSGSVKGWLYRAIQALKAGLQEKGWEDWTPGK